MWPSFIGILDIQSWWEVPSIAHFCSLFRAAFNLLDFDIEELEETLLTDGTEECASSLLTELIVRLLRGCLGNNDITTSNYQMFLRRLFRQKCQETGHSNIFNADIDFQFLPLRRKVQILQALCNFRLGADDVFDLLKNLEAESLRVEPLGWDDNASAYWYFYGTRLYREDYIVKPKGKKRKGAKEEKKSKREVDGADEKTDRVWQVVCFTEADWIHLTEKFKDSTSRVEKDLYLSLSENFLPEIPRLFQEKERLRRKRLLESLPRRTSTRVQTKKQKEEDEQKQDDSSYKNDDLDHKSKKDCEREKRARQRELNRSQSCSSQSGKSRSRSRDPTARVEDQCPEQPSQHRQRSKPSAERRDGSAAAIRPSGRQTNNSLACATGQILIPEQKEHPNRKKIKTSQIFGLMEEDVQTDMYKVLDQLKAHEDAWPFMNPVEEDIAPNYYSVIRRPMDLQRIEDRLDQGYYTDFSMFQSDFNLIVKNCRLYNGQDNEYTEMVDNLEAAFNRLTQRYFERLSSSDDEIAIDYSYLNPSPRKHLEKTVPVKKSENNQIGHKRKRVLSTDDEQSSKTRHKEDEKPTSNKDDIKIYHNDSDNSKSSLSEFSKSVLKKKKKKFKNSKKKHKDHKDKHASKKNKEKRKHSHHTSKKNKKNKRMRHPSVESLEQSDAGTSQCEIKESNKWETSDDAIFYKDKYDKIKERRRGLFKLTTSGDNISETSKASNKNRQNVVLSDKNKNSKLKETIEKLKAKSQKNIDDSNSFDDYFKPSSSKKIKHDGNSKSPKISKTKIDEYEFKDDFENILDSKHESRTSKSKNKKQSSIAHSKNESASEALEQAAKDFCKLFDEPSKNTEYGSNSNSPSQISDDYHRYTSKYDEDSNLNLPEKDKFSQDKRNVKRRVHKDLLSKISSRKKEVQRTIERLQPGKTKGNLISNIQSTSKQDDVVAATSGNKAKDVKITTVSKPEESISPKLSLGTVLDSVGFGIEKQHNFNTELVMEVPIKIKEVETISKEEVKETQKEVETCKTETSEENKKAELEPAKTKVSNASQDKATPNLSAWFKAFGAPKSGTGKKKTEESDQDDSKSNDTKISSAEAGKSDQAGDEFLPEGGESPLPSHTNTGRVRRTSTGSSVSERSSFSQDLDSPRHHPSHTSPLIRSPASPRIDDHQKNLYPPLNGTVRVGFYQDTASLKSSPEKSCSPRDAPQSPYAAYSQHVYASNAAQTTNQTTAENMSKSPLTGFGQSYYESSKKRPQDDYSVFGSDSIYKPPVSPTTSFSPAHSSSYSQHSQHSPYSHIQHSPQTFTAGNVLLQYDKAMEKSVFPVKKRSYSGNQHATGNTSNNDSVTDSNVVASNKLDLTMINNSPISYDSKTTVNSNFMHNTPSVITSTNQKVQYSSCSTRDTYSDSNALKTPYDFTTMSRLNIPSMPKDPQSLDVKNLPFVITDNNKSQAGNVATANQNKSCGENNMGYVDNLSSEKLSKIDGASNKTHRNYNMYSIVSNQPYQGLVDINSKTSAESNQIYHQDKFTSNMQYSNMPLDTTKRTGEDLSIIESYKKAKQNYTDSVNLSTIDSYNKTLSIPDWKMDYANKNVDQHSYSSYRHMAESDHTKNNMVPTYDSSLVESGDTLQKLQPDLRLPLSDHQQSAQDYLSRSKNAMNLHSNKAVEGIFGHNSQLSACHSPISVDQTSRNLSAQLMDRFKEDRLLGSFPTNPLSYEKSIPLSPLYPKNVHNNLHNSNNAGQMFPTSLPMPFNRNSMFLPNMQPNMHNLPGMEQVTPPETEKKSKSRKKKTAEVQPAISTSGQPFHLYSGLKSTQSTSKTELKSNNMVPGSAFNFGTPGLPSGLYTDGNFLELRNPSISPYGYMQRGAPDPAEKKSELTSANAYRFLPHPQARPGYPFLGMDPSSSLYPQFIQRHHEEMFRHPGAAAQMMDMFPAAYQNALGSRQPYDAMNRNTWL